MCGIVGYIGHREASDFLLEGLRRLEYRGYDSAGVAVLRDSVIDVTKAAGRIELLSEKLAQRPAVGSPGIGHTRWATHGPATEVNAHPHFGGDQRIAVVHNGVIENYKAIKERLILEGFSFQSATDSEVIAHLIDSCLEKHLADEHNSNGTHGRPYAILLEAVREAIGQLRGTYGLVVLFRDFPDVMIAARLGSPLVVGVGDNEYFVASDASPLAGYTDKIVFLADHQVAVITANELQVTHRDQGEVQHNIEPLTIESDDVGLDGFPHYMLKEIFEQPESLRNTMRGRFDEDNWTSVFGGLNLTPQQLRGCHRILLTACGTSWHAAMVGEYMMEELARVPVEVEYASEAAISQSTLRA